VWKVAAFAVLEIALLKTLRSPTHHGHRSHAHKKNKKQKTKKNKNNNNKKSDHFEKLCQQLISQLFTGDFFFFFCWFGSTSRQAPDR
jgi:hypothetical protein